MRIYSTFLVVVLYSYGYGQNPITGMVKDKETKQPLIGCTVFVLNATAGSSTDLNGRFKLSAKENDRLVFSYLGYQNDTIRIEHVKTTIEILLTPIHKVLDEVVITAISKATLIKQSPISISNITPKMIDRSNENNIIDVLAKNTPGLNALKTGPNISKPFIRGMGFNRVLTLYDGVRQEGQQWGGEHGLEIDNYNIDRAEVIKGPASLVYGSDAMAGVVSLLPYIPKESGGKINGRILSEYQGNNGLIGNGFRVSSGTQHWLWGVRGAYRLARNYTNKIDGRVYNTGFQEKNLSAMVGYKSAKWFTHFNLSLYDNLQGIPDGSRDSLTRKFTQQIYEGVQDNIKHRPIVSNAELNSFTLSPLHQRIQHYRIYANHHYNFRYGDVNFLVAFTQNIRREFNHPTAPGQPGTHLRLNTLNYNLRYNAPEFSHIETSVGVNGMFQNNKNIEASNFPVPDYHLTDFGAFVVGKWKKEKWTVVGGGRFDARSIHTSDLYSGIDPKTGFGKQVAPGMPGAMLQFPTISQSFRGVSFSLGSTHQFNDIFNLKLNNHLQSRWNC